MGSFPCLLTYQNLTYSLMDFFPSSFDVLKYHIRRADSSNEPDGLAVLEGILMDYLRFPPDLLDSIHSPQIWVWIIFDFAICISRRCLRSFTSVCVLPLLDFLIDPILVLEEFWQIEEFQEHTLFSNNKFSIGSSTNMFMLVHTSKVFPRNLLVIVHLF